MNLYIETENNQPKNHPAIEDNLIQAFGEIPNHWVLFTRVEQPTINIYEVYEGLTYELVDGSYTDVHHIRDMTAEEKLEKQTTVKEAWNNYHPSWTFNEATCTFQPPVEYPQDSNRYVWNEELLGWDIIDESAV
jgi:hypothetical protein